MNVDLIRQWLTVKFTDLQSRTRYVLDQLSDEQVNWRPDDESNSIANLVYHMTENIKERIGKGIHQFDYTRDRDREFELFWISRAELIELITVHFDELIRTTQQLPEEAWFQTQLIRNNERTNMDILLQSATHFSEHVGQILYIAKMCLGEAYKTTSIPKKRS